MSRETALAVYIAVMLVALVVGRATGRAAVEFVGGLMLIAVVCVLVFAIGFLVLFSPHQESEHTDHNEDSV